MMVELWNQLGILVFPQDILVYQVINLSCVP